ncbi:hypothetical protein CH267_06845 [Rhodococcus sp. 06-621-2]|nr:hypothetical protein CH267_06845 [Rhodococcus sp. 06-621-2]
MVLHVGEAPVLGSTGERGFTGDLERSDSDAPAPRLRCRRRRDVCPRGGRRRDCELFVCTSATPSRSVVSVDRAAPELDIRSPSISFIDVIGAITLTRRSTDSAASFSGPRRAGAA